MKQRLFGTDGLRGQGNIYPMTPEIVLKLGLAAGQYFRNGNKHRRVVIGKDTRLSGYVFETALTSGLCANGMDVFLVGPMPTPAISFLTQSMRASLGVVISASHNPFMDNGIKFFDSNGFKLPDAVEDEISELVLADEPQWEYPVPEDIGRAFRVSDAPGRYIVYLKHSFSPNLTLDGLKIVLDCANGAAYSVAPSVLEELGADVIKVGVHPDGININHKCGSLYPQVLSRVVMDEGADMGIALDGDGDRLSVCDEKGRILDGDQIMALSALELMEKERLPKNMLVSTVMSNMALEIFMSDHGGQLLRTAVGDRYVVEAMRREGAMLGGEQSGHLIFMEHSTTGDGLLAALQLLRIMCEKEQPLSKLAGLLEPFPQILKNVHVKRKIPFDDAPEVQKTVRRVEAAMNGKGRVLLRYSGTEAVCRVMVEGQDRDKVERYVDEIVDVCEKYLK